jgi:hypothetical protein
MPVAWWVGGSCSRRRMPRRARARHDTPDASRRRRDHMSAADTGHDDVLAEAAIDAALDAGMVIPGDIVIPADPLD